MYDLKKALSIFLLTAFLFDLFGYLPLFKIAQYKIRKEIKTLLKERVPENELCVITIPVRELKDIDWKREGKEFKRNGTMYDIVSYKTENDVIHYYCVNDEQETKLFVHLEETVNQQMNNDKSPIGKTAKNLLKLFKYISRENAILAMANSSPQSTVFDYCFFYPPVFIEIPSPPPNQAV